MANDRFLLIWEVHPDEVKFYSLPAEEVEAERFTLDHAHGVLINASGENDEYALRIQGFLSLASDAGIVTTFDGKWARYQLHISELPTHEFLGVFTSGFML